MSLDSDDAARSSGSIFCICWQHQQPRWEGPYVHTYTGQIRSSTLYRLRVRLGVVFSHRASCSSAVFLFANPTRPRIRKEKKKKD
jgi:hypothetical protein